MKSTPLGQLSGISELRMSSSTQTRKLGFNGVLARVHGLALPQQGFAFTGLSKRMCLSTQLARGLCPAGHAKFTAIA